MQRKQTVYILILVLLIGVCLRSLAMLAEDDMSHDESVSYLAASGNWGAYQQAVEGAEPYGSWVPASTWKTFLEPRPSLPFGSISADLARLDVHPPLYFWLLHVGMLVFGLHNWTGTAVNLILFIPSTIALYFLARRLLKNEQEAAFVCLIWAASPALIDVTTEARQYELLGLAIILFMWAISSYADTTKPFRWSSWVALVVTTAVGLLSHYHFVLVLAGAGLFFLAKQMWADRHRLLWGAGGIMVGAGLFLVAHPRFLDSFSLLANRQDQQISEYWTWIDLARRIYAMGYTYTRFFVYGSLLQVVLFCWEH